MGKAVFYIKNYAYNEDQKYLYAGDSYNGNVYVNGKNRPSAKWIFEAVLNKNGTETGYFHIKDMSHSKYIVAGENYNGNIYHGPLKGGLNEQWQFEFASFNGNIGWVITDRKHNKSLVGGHSYNGQVYHQDAKDGTQVKVEAIWEVDYCENGTKVEDFPSFFLKSNGKVTECEIKHISTNSTEVYSMSMDLDSKEGVNKSFVEYTFETTHDEQKKLTTSTKITDAFTQKIIVAASVGKPDSWKIDVTSESVFSFEKSTETTTEITKKETKKYSWTYHEEVEVGGKYKVMVTCSVDIITYHVNTKVDYIFGGKLLKGEFLSVVVVEKGNKWKKTILEKVAM